MKQFILTSWNAIMDNRITPLRHPGLATQHYFLQVPGWMWSMVFREGETQLAAIEIESGKFSSASHCIWKLDSEA